MDRSLTELESAAADALALDVPVRFDLGVDVKRNVVEFRIAEASTLGQDPVARAAFEAQLPAAVELQLIEQLGGPSANIYAGLDIGCTAGFTILHPSTGLKGITTAAHCGNSQSYGGQGLPYRGERLGGSNDSQWHTVGTHTPKNWAKDVIQDPTPNCRVITWRQHRANMFLGDYLCKYGKKTGFTCGEIVSRHEAPGWIPSAAATFIQLHDPGGDDLSTLGDSGGPVYSAGGAWGITSGCYPTPFGCNDAIFVATNFVHASMGVVVLTAP